MRAGARSLLVFLAAGCSLAPPPPPPRLLLAADPLPYLESPAAATGVTAAPLLRLRRVTAEPALNREPLLREDGVYRRATDWQWLEEPRTWLEQGLRQVLFAGGAFRSAGAGAPSLEVGLEAFEADVGSKAEVRVVLRARLEDRQGLALYEGRLEVRQPLTGMATPGAIAEALARALADALTRLRVALPSEKDGPPAGEGGRR